MSGATSLLGDMSHFWGEDLDETPSGDIAVATGAARTVQRIIRRLMTVQTEVGNSQYPWEPTYGAGLPIRIGNQVNVLDLQGLVLAQMRLEASVALDPAPAVQIDLSQQSAGVYTINITYTDQSGLQQNFSFDLSP